MRNCGKRNVRKHKELKKGDGSVAYENKYEILEISDKIDILVLVGDTLITLFELLMLPNIALSTVYHAYRPNNSFFSPARFSSQNVFRVEQP